MYDVHTVVSRYSELCTYIDELTSALVPWMLSARLAQVRIVVFADIPGLLWDTVEECDAADRSQGGPGVVDEVLVIELAPLMVAAHAAPCVDALHDVFGAALARLRDGAPPASCSRPGPRLFQIKPVTVDTGCTGGSVSSADPEKHFVVSSSSADPDLAHTGGLPHSALSPSASIAPLLSSVLPGTHLVLNMFRFTPG
ncbi:uncharacterized protein AMSG_08351 [Thecamonas trahens ATCC 50062]|uniref:Uncharacterized protein n=1 Tax=Thecamonas trahens ATCC 50062 TaxID=461836 RepID=A0A0L0DJ04_THETB|nr:hypothetical protein AMSG_08351 [Thecamonas trahens ATCC 50062]KNC52379.1 hypothetical protein AMSG_08351 [Thecamonas trahens ATCC 50062]|eukprot:XP_013755426.1 hypothetical protein AMSG_08351 [Thecamonas trahens ATCC 50062]